jgi:putative oxidoreductase
MVGGWPVDMIALIGRILFVANFLASGVAHLTQTRGMEGYVVSKGLRRASLLIQVSGVQMLVGGLMVLLGVWMDLGLLVLAAFLIPAAVLFHAFWNVGDPELANVERAHFHEDDAPPRFRRKPVGWRVTGAVLGGVTSAT